MNPSAKTALAAAPGQGTAERRVKGQLFHDALYAQPKLSDGILDIDTLRQRTLRWLRPRPVAVVVGLMLAAALAAKAPLTPLAATNLLTAECLRRGEGLTVWGQPPEGGLRPGMPGLLAVWQGLAGAGTVGLSALMWLTLSLSVACCYGVWTQFGSRPMALLAALVTGSSLAVTAAACQPTAAGPVLCLVAAATFAWLRGAVQRGRWLWIGSAAWLAACAFHRDALPLVIGAAVGLVWLGDRSTRAIVCSLWTVTAGVGTAWHFDGPWLGWGPPDAGVAHQASGALGGIVQLLSVQTVSTVGAMLLLLPMLFGAATLWHGASRIAVCSLAAYGVARVLLGAGDELGWLPVGPIVVWCLLEGLPRLASRLRCPPAHAAALPLMAGSLLVVANTAQTLGHLAWPTQSAALAGDQSLRDVAQFLLTEQAPGDRLIAPVQAAPLSYLSHLPCEPTDAAERFVHVATAVGAVDGGPANATLIVLPRAAETTPLADALKRTLRYHSGYTTVYRNDHFEVYRRLDATAVRILAAKKPASVGETGPSPPRLARRDRSSKRPPNKRQM